MIEFEDSGWTRQIALPGGPYTWSFLMDVLGFLLENDENLGIPRTAHRKLTCSSRAGDDGWVTMMMAAPNGMEAVAMAGFEL